MKKIFYLVVTIVIFCLAISIAEIFAADSDFQFDIDSQTIVKYQGNESNIIIPDTIAGYPVTKIGNNAFRNNADIISLIINSNITEIGNSAFGGCNSLTDLTINADTLKIQEGAFGDCGKLTSLQINCNNELTLSSYVFSGCQSLKSLELPIGTINIGDGTFGVCSSLESILIPNTVKNIGVAAFVSCSSLKSITIPDSVTSIGDKAFMSCTSLQNLEIPKSVTGEIRSITENCSSLKSIDLGAVTKISIANFHNTLIENLIIPASVEEVSGNAFAYSNLMNIIFLNDNIDIEKDNFDGINEDCVIYCGVDSNALKAAVGAGIKYEIIDTSDPDIETKIISQSTKKENITTESLTELTFEKTDEQIEQNKTGIETVETEYIIDTENSNINILIITVFIIILFVVCGLGYYFIIHKNKH